MIKITLSLGFAASAPATTSRYWNCYGGACGCGFGSDNKSTKCHSNALFAATPGNTYGALFYGTAAISPNLGGGEWPDTKEMPYMGCGKCFKLTGTSNVDPEVKNDTVIVVKATDYCDPTANPLCANSEGIPSNHFEIAAPGFNNPGEESLKANCDRVGEEPALRFPQTCQDWMVNTEDPNENCDCGEL